MEQQVSAHTVQIRQGRGTGGIGRKHGLLPDADFLSLLCSCAHLLAIEGNEVLILDLFWQSLAFQVKDSPDLYSILKIKRMNLCMLTDVVKIG